MSKRIRKKLAAESLDTAASKLEPAESLKTARTLLGWTQQQMADRLGTDQPRIAEWESGRKRPSDQTRQKFRALAGELRD